MARVIGYIGVSHVPAIGSAMARRQQSEPYWRPFFEGLPAAHEWIRDRKPDVILAFYNDHGLNFFLDKLPTFAIGAAHSYDSGDDGWGLPDYGSYAGYPELSWHLLEELVDAEFDPVSCQEMLVDHGFSVPLQLLFPEGLGRIRTVPIAINTVQHPLPSPRRCFKLGQAVAQALECWHPDERVLVLGTGGLSHQLDGERAGFINRRFDEVCLDQLVEEPEMLTVLTNHELVRFAGTQGVELLNWIAARGAVAGPVRQVHRHYHIPVSNTAAALLVLENLPD